MSSTEPRYPYSSLLSKPESFRLLRLIRPEHKTAPIKGQLFNYSLHESETRPPQYEALSYVWGDPKKTLPISIDDYCFDVTENLHAALWSLRDRSVSWLWVDAICINQLDPKERGHQVRYMAKIYGKASRVLVWLGEAGDNSDRAFTEIRERRKWTDTSDDKTIKQAVLALLQRPWFRRIWILQETAAARRILIMCGQAEIDGYGFCLGLKSLQNLYKDRLDLHNLIHSVIYLIRQANFRPTHTPWSDMSFLAIRPLGELLDMFHTHEATKCHDKVYALLGMSSDGLDAVNLLPNYEIKWGEVFRRLIKFLLRGPPVCVETKDTTEMAIITSKASILGRVSSVAPCSGWGDTYKVVITSRTTFGCIGYAGEWNACWTLHNSAKSIQQDDIVCILQGAPNPTIVRVCKDYLAIIMILATPPDDERTQKGCIRWSKLLQSARTSSYELLLVWDWAKFPERARDREAYEALLETTYLDKVLGLKGLQDQIQTYVERRQWQPTGELGMRLMTAFRKMLGEEHSSTLNSMSNLALMYMNQARWKDSEELVKQLVETRTRVLGEQHPSTLISMSNLALTYMNQRRWKDAEELGKKVVETITRVLGKKHPSTLISMSNLALTYMNQERWKDAEELVKQLVETRTRVLGKKHPSTLISMSNLALTYRNQGRWKDAEELEEQVVKTRTRVLGEEHRSTLISMSNLALTYTNQRRWKDAEELGKKVVESITRVLGEEHPSKLTSMSNLVSAYMHQARWKDAEELEVQVIEMRTRVLGEKHPSTLISMSNLALTYINQRRWKDAEELGEQVVETITRVLGEKHPSTLISMSNLALTYMNQGRWKDAEELGKKVVETITRVLGEKHPYTLISKSNLALTHINQGRWKDAEELGEQVIR